MNKKASLLVIALVVSLTACNQNVKQESKSLKPDNNVNLQDNNVEAVANRYLKLKNTLVQSDSVESAAAARDLALFVDSLKGFDSIARATKQIANSLKLAQQRSAFTHLSELLIRTVEQAGVKKGTVYVQYCPMANENNGGYWISGNPEIRNPYYGDEMLECGEVKKKINRR